MKQTWQKQIVLDTVKNMKNHPTADQVYKEISGQNYNIGIATVYRNLNSFVKKGLICKIVIPNTADRFDYRLDKHEHFMCEKCGKVWDADVTVKITPAKHTMQYTDYSLILFGVCDECQGAKSPTVQ